MNGIGYGLLVGLMALAAENGGEAYRRCNALAGSPFEPENRDSGIGVVDTRRLDAPAAIRACSAAAGEDPRSAPVMMRLGRAHYAGGDYARALPLYQAAADAGYVPALNGLGYLYFTGQGVAQDNTRAWELFYQAAEGGYAPGQYSLGWMYLNGVATEVDHRQAFVQFSAAAEAGHHQAMSNLGYLHQHGLGQPVDPAEARRWYRRAAEGGDAYGAGALGQLYEQGLGGSASLTEAVRWYRLGAEGGDASAQFHLAGLYEAGRGVPRDHNQALAWYRKAADQGHQQAQQRLDRHRAAMAEATAAARRALDKELAELYNRKLDLLIEQVRIRYSEETYDKLIGLCFKLYDLLAEQRRLRLRLSPLAAHLRHFNYFVEQETRRKKIVEKNKQCGFFFAARLGEHERALPYAIADFRAHHNSNPADRHSAEMLWLIFETGRGGQSRPELARQWQEEAKTRGGIAGAKP